MAIQNLYADLNPASFMSLLTSPHLGLTRSEWMELQEIRTSDRPLVVDGYGLTIAGVIAVAL